MKHCGMLVMLLPLLLLAPVRYVTTEALAGDKHVVKADPLTGYQETPTVNSTGSGIPRSSLSSSPTRI